MTGRVLQLLPVWYARNFKTSVNALMTQQLHQKLYKVQIHGCKNTYIYSTGPVGVRLEAHQVIWVWAPGFQPCFCILQLQKMWSCISFLTLAELLNPALWIFFCKFRQRWRSVKGVRDSARASALCRRAREPRLRPPDRSPTSYGGHSAENPIKPQFQAHAQERWSMLAHQGTRPSPDASPLLVPLPKPLSTSLSHSLPTTSLQGECCKANKPEPHALASGAVARLLNKGADWLIDRPAPVHAPHTFPGSLP